MGRDIEILEEQINKLAQDKEAALANPDLTDEERKNVEESFNRALEGIEQGLVGLALKTKNKIQLAISNYEKEINENEAYIKAAEEEFEQRKAEMNEELGKENPDMGVIEAKTAQLKALEKRIKELKSAIRKANKEVKEQKKLLLPLMYKFKDKVFSEEEIADLEKLDKKIQAGKRLSEKNKKDVETPAVEEETVAEEVPAVEEEPVAEEVPAVEEEPVAEETPAVEEEPVVVGTIPKAATETVVEEEKVEEVAEEVSEEKPVDMKKEFRQLYAKAKNGTLKQEDYDRLVEIMSDAENYDKYGVSTGLFNNKAKVVLKAMGKFATKNVEKTVVDGKENFGVSVPEKSKTVVATGYAKKWSTIEELIDSPVIKLKAQVICEEIIASAEEKGVESLSEEEIAVYEKAKKYTKNLRGFRTSMNGYRRTRELRRERFFGWLSKRKESEPAAIAEADVPLAPPNEDLATSLRREVKETSEIESEKTKDEVAEPEVDFAPFEIDG